MDQSEFEADAKRGKYQWTNQNSKPMLSAGNTDGPIRIRSTCTKLGYFRVWFFVFIACKTNPIAKLLRKLEQQNKLMSLTRRKPWFEKLYFFSFNCGAQSEKLVNK